MAPVGAEGQAEHLRHRDAYQAPSPSFNLFCLRDVQHIVSARRLAWSLVGAFARRVVLVAADAVVHRGGIAGVVAP
ncbi:MAG: hypothetical protein M3N52_06180 [Actinomycetota bacterium]|nr:hypothetical protein [Actinomycetota bacterium]